MRAAVLGSPIAHSLSPVLHRAAYAALGLSGGATTASRWTRPRCPASWPVSTRRRGLGRPVADDAAEAGGDPAAGLGQRDRAAAVDAVNTVVFHADGRRTGDNTDVPGLVAALRERGVDHGGRRPRCSAPAPPPPRRWPRWRRSATARSPRTSAGPSGPAQMRAAGANGSGVKVRTARGSAPAEAFATPLIVSTTPVGATDHLADAVPRPPGALFDVLYHPWPTALAAAWSRARRRPCWAVSTCWCTRRCCSARCSPASGPPRWRRCGPRARPRWPRRAEGGLEGGSGAPSASWTGAGHRATGVGGSKPKHARTSHARTLEEAPLGSLRWLTAGESHGPALVGDAGGPARRRAGHHGRRGGRPRAPPARLRPRRPDEVRAGRGHASSAASGTG